MMINDDSNNENEKYNETNKSIPTPKFIKIYEITCRKAAVKRLKIKSRF